MTSLIYTSNPSPKTITFLSQSSMEVQKKSVGCVGLGGSAKFGLGGCAGSGLGGSTGFGLDGGDGGGGFGGDGGEKAA